MFFEKTQASTESLIIFSIVLILAVAVISIAAWFPGLSLDISEKDSHAYWSNVSPIAITDWTITPNASESRIVMKNNTSTPLYVDDILIEDNIMGLFPDVLILPGEKKTVKGLVGVSAPYGTKYKYKIGYAYYFYNETTVSDKTFYGEMPLVGISTGRVSTCECTNWNDYACNTTWCNGKMQQVRTCVPSDCDSMSQCVCDNTCCNSYCISQGKISGFCFLGFCACRIV